jgi:hypothetical protein
MMQNRQNMLDAANTMMQGRQTMMDMQRQGMMGPMMGQQNMPMMMQGINNMSQGMAQMQKYMSNMQQAQGMMGMQPMRGSGGFGFMGPMMGPWGGQGMWQGHMGWHMGGPMMGQGMMGSGMMGPMMGWQGMGPMMMWNQTSPMGFMGMMNIQTVQPLTIDNVKKAAEDLIKSLGNPDLAVKDIMEFERNFYFIVYEKDTGTGAFEMLVWKSTAGTMMAGIMHPEPGPNMMWNTGYGMMQFAQPTTQMTVTHDKAESLAQAYLDTNFPGTTVEDVDEFHGYYTLHTEKDSKISGMLSVNGFTGDIWYHWWHGQFIQELEE